MEAEERQAGSDPGLTEQDREPVELELSSCNPCGHERPKIDGRRYERHDGSFPGAHGILTAMNGTVRLVILSVLLGSVGFAFLPAEVSAQAATQAQVDSLRAEVEELKAQLEELQAQEPVDDVAADTTDAVAKLRAAAEAAAAEADTLDTPSVQEEQEFVGRQRSLQALNPEISVTADLFAAVGTEDPDSDNFVPREFEFSFQSALDPYSRAKIFVSHETPGAEIVPFIEEDEEEEEGGVAIEEGYVEWVSLPGGLGLKFGQFFQQFGTLNRWHQHALPFQSRSLPHLALIGEEALAQAGVSAHWLVPVSGGGTYELTFELNRSSNEELFGESKGPSLLGHLNGFWQLTEAVDLDLGVSALLGDHDTEESSYDQRLYGVEGALTWAPPDRSRYRGIVIRGGVMVRDPGDVPTEIEARGATGAWINGEAQLSQSWFIGGRYGWVENPDDPGESTWLVAPTLTWWQSEWVRLRAEYDVINRSGDTEGLFVIQATMAMGPHKHETY